jgi:hypothetical protein
MLGRGDAASYVSHAAEAVLPHLLARRVVWRVSFLAAAPNAPAVLIHSCSRTAAMVGLPVGDFSIRLKMKSTNAPLDFIRGWVGNRVAPELYL